MNKKEFKWAFVRMIMKKEVNLFELVFIVFFGAVFFYLLVLASKVRLPFISLDNTFFMLLIVTLIWIIYILYLWRILKNAKKSKKR